MHTGNQFILRPLDIKQFFDFAIRLYRSRFTALFLAMALVQLPLSLLSIPILFGFLNFATKMQESAMRGDSPDTLMVDALDQAPVFLALMGLAAAYQLLVLPLSYLACSRLAWGSLHGVTYSLREAFAHARRRYWPTQVALATFLLPLLVLALLVLVPVLALQLSGNMAGVAGSAMLAMLLIFSGMFATFLMWFRYFPALSGIVQAGEEPEATGVIGQGLWYLKRTYGLTSGYFLRCLGLLIVIFIAVYVVERGITQSLELITMLIQAATAQEGKALETIFQTSGAPNTLAMSVVYVGGSVVSLLFPALIVCYQVLLYFDLRCRKEGYDLLYQLEGGGPA